MSSVPPISGVLGSIIGAVQQLVNELTERVPMPTGPVPAVPLGDLIEPRGDAQRAGADAVDRLFDRITGRGRTIDPQTARQQRPLLAQTTITCGDVATSTRLQVAATAPDADWGSAGRECALVAVYIDGRYHSTIVVLNERNEGYEVNLGPLPPGQHTIELRAATDIAPTRACVSSVTAKTLMGDAALIDRLAPVIQLRDADPTGRMSISHSDTPMMLVPAVTRHRDGSRTIEYRGVFSNENGGTKTTTLFSKYGRGADAEPLYRVTVDANGRVLRAEYQATVHRWLPFDGVQIGQRPVLRISTANNMVSTRLDTQGCVEQWSDAPVAPIAGEASEYQTMVEHGWTWKVTAKELMREGKSVAVAAASRGVHLIGDPRHYLYFEAASDAVRGEILAAGGLEVALTDGRHVRVRVTDPTLFASGRFRMSALELPDGVTADAVRGVALLGVKAHVLDEAFDVRVLAHAA